MGEIVRHPHCREVSPELLRAIARRTRNASYWVRYWAVYWSVVNCIADEMCTDEVNERAIEDVRLCVLGWLHDRNRAAIKARGF
jgi:hypothetical protein